jgi:hypothetical protein
MLHKFSFFLRSTQSCSLSWRYLREMDSNEKRKLVPNEDKLNEILKNLRVGGRDNFQLILGIVAFFQYLYSCVRFRWNSDRHWCVDILGSHRKLRVYAGTFLFLKPKSQKLMFRSIWCESKSFIIIIIQLKSITLLLMKKKYEFDSFIRSSMIWVIWTDC